MVDEIFRVCEHCASCSTSLSGEYCDIDGSKIQDVTTHICKNWSQVEQDNYLEEIWAGLIDIPINPKTETLDERYHIWDVGTSKEDIWHYFDVLHSKGVAYLLNLS